MTFLAVIHLAVRVLVVAALLFASIVALTHWAVRSRRLDAFGRWPRLVRKMSDPVLQPVEQRILRAGGNPQNAPLWLLGIVVGAGLILMSLTAWIIDTVLRLQWMAQRGPQIWIESLVGLLFTVLMAAILIRVIGSWLGIGRYRKWMRPFYLLTDWLIDPIRRILPPFGMIDFSPMVAWLVLYVVRGFVMGLL
ncbi:MAG TPA: YggT family protein [Gemmatimonadales bacterium]|nr:YggT family protein [Gemmatimonadales bacterium]